MLGPLDLDAAVKGSRVMLGGRVYEMAPETIQAMMQKAVDNCPKCGERSMPPCRSKPENTPVLRMCILCRCVEHWRGEASC